MGLYNTIADLFTNPAHTRWIAPLIVLGEAVVCAGIIQRVQYTEIDWTTYMAQVQLFLNGERRYAKLTGPTGPLVYPAIHLYLYSFLHWVTDKGTNIFLAQCIFAGFYLITISLVLAAYRRINAPPWLLIPLALSKRLHSIFLLRLFNDAPTAMMLWASIYLLQRRQWWWGAGCWGTAVGIKMIALLALPGMAMVLVQGAGAENAAFGFIICVWMNVTAAFPFLEREYGLQYFTSAFDLSRKFLFKWTVNWRFVGEETFTSKNFAISLLVLHVSILAVFVQTKWIRLSSTGVYDFVKKYWRTMPQAVEVEYSKKVTPTFVMDAILASMAVGLLCARSLHYQFYAYLGWASPYLLWRAGGGPIWVLLNWAVQEYCWLVYPSTDISSMLVVFELAVQVLSALIAPPVDHIAPPAQAEEKAKSS